MKPLNIGINILKIAILLLLEKGLNKVQLGTKLRCDPFSTLGA